MKRFVIGATIGVSVRIGAALIWQYKQERVRLVWAAILDRPIAYRLHQHGGTLYVTGRKNYVGKSKFTRPPLMHVEGEGHRITDSDFGGGTAVEMKGKEYDVHDRKPYTNCR